MEVKCEKCSATDRGRLGKLLQRGWLLVFVDKGCKVVRCKDCKPELWHRKQYFKEFNTEINNAIWKKIEKIRILKALKR